ncbi:MAG: lycopene cyclase family protein, partial [Bacteroidota bacterium]
MEDYDFIIAGGGCSGLSLAYHLSHIPNIRLLIIESQPAIRNDKTWCFWSDQQPWFPQCIRKSWSTMSFASKTDQIREHIAPYQYHYIASEDFYAFVLEALADNPLVDYQQETIQNIIPDPRGSSCAPPPAAHAPPPATQPTNASRRSSRAPSQPTTRAL